MRFYACLRLFVIIAVSSFCSASIAFAQTEGQAGIEGYVFNLRTMKPLDRVEVVYAAVFNYPGDGPIFGTETDANGFYQMDAATPEGAGNNYVFAVCRTHRGDYHSGITLYLPLRPTQVYRRDIYINLPEGIDSCL